MAYTKELDGDTLLRKSFNSTNRKILGKGVASSAWMDRLYLDMMKSLELRWRELVGPRPLQEKE